MQWNSGLPPPASFQLPAKAAVSSSPAGRLAATTSRTCDVRDALLDDGGGDPTSHIPQRHDVERHARKLQGVVGLGNRLRRNQQIVDTAGQNGPIGDFHRRPKPVRKQAADSREGGIAEMMRVKIRFRQADRVGMLTTENHVSAA